MIGLTLALLFAPQAEIAYVSGGDIWTCDLAGKNRVRVVKNGDRPCWSPDHKKLCFARGRGFLTFDLAAKREFVLQISDAEGESGRPSWGPRFAVSRVAEGQKPFGQGDSILFQMDNFGKPVTQSTSDRSKIEEAKFLPITSDTGVESPTWNHAGNAVAFALEGDIWVAQVEEFGWQSHRLLPTAIYDIPTWRGSTMNVYARTLSWSPDGKRLAYTRERVGGSGFNEAWVVPIKTVQGRVQAGTPTRISEFAMTVSFTRDGKHLVSEGQKEGVWGIWLYSFATRKWTMLVKNASNPAG